MNVEAQIEPVEEYLNTEMESCIIWIGGAPKIKPIFFMAMDFVPELMRRFSNTSFMIFMYLPATFAAMAARINPTSSESGIGIFLQTI